MADTAARPAILVVEDESLLRIAAVDMLEEAGYRVVEAETGDEGRAALGSGVPIAGLLTGVQMPGTIDGFALARLAREMHPDAAIVVVSGLARPADADLPPGATFLGKPYTNRAVLHALERMTGRLTV